MPPHGGGGFGGGGFGGGGGHFGGGHGGGTVNDYMIPSIYVMMMTNFEFLLFFKVFMEGVIITLVVVDFITMEEVL